MSWPLEVLLWMLVRDLALRDHPLPLPNYGLPLTSNSCPSSSSAYLPTRSSICLPVLPSTCPLDLPPGVSSHGASLTPPSALPIPPFAMALPPHLPESLSRLSLGELAPSAPRLSQADNWETMPSIRAAIAALSRTLIDIKFAVRRTYEAVCSSVNQNSDMASVITHVCTQLSCQDSRIDDLERNIIELMGKVDRIQEDLAVYFRATQGSWVHENTTVNQEINQLRVDASSVKLRKKG